MGVYINWGITIEHSGEISQERLAKFCDTHEYFDDFYDENYYTLNELCFTLGGESTSFNAADDLNAECIDFLRYFPNAEISVISQSEDEELPQKTVYKRGEIIDYETIVTYKEVKRAKIE